MIGKSETPASEGVIKFKLDYTPKPLAIVDQLNVMNAWREVLLRLALIGCDPRRYDGNGFGNMSYRIPISPKARDPILTSQFLVTGTQTGHLAKLSDSDFAIVKQADPEKNHIVAEGPAKPSSEALTHAAIYSAEPTIQWIIHVHSPDIWNLTHRLSIPAIASDIAYGTPMMATAVKQLIRQTTVSSPGIFSMLGHEDGIVCFGANAEDAGLTVTKYLSLALALEHQLA